MREIWVIVKEIYLSYFNYPNTYLSRCLAQPLGGLGVCLGPQLIKKKKMFIKK
jgi:hypothetical protein